MKTRGGWLRRNPTMAKALALAIVMWLVGIGVYGVLRDDVSVPVSLSRHGVGRYYHFHGAAAWLIAAGFLCLGASAMVTILRPLTGKTDQRPAVDRPPFGGPGWMFV